MNPTKHTMNEYIIILGPPASGKTLNREALRKHYKCDHVFDGGFDRAKIVAAAGRIMVLTCDPNLKGPSGHRKMFKNAVWIPVRAAEIALGSRWIAPEANSPH